MLQEKKAPRIALLALLLFYFCLEIISARSENENVRQNKASNIEALKKEQKNWQKNENGNMRCQCGRTEIGRMQPMEMINLEDDEPIELLYENKKKLGKGAYSKVLHAQLGKIGDKIYNKCVAVKMTTKDLTNSDWQKHIKEWKIQREFDTLREKERSHVIKLLAFGHHQIDEIDYVFSILELGTCDLVMHMKQKRTEWLRNEVQVDDAQLKPELRQLFETVRDMHQKIMHLDMKPQNLLYMQEDKALMKVIDFGASQFIDEDDQWEEGRQNKSLENADSCKWIVLNDPLTTEVYQSPEHHAQCNWKYEPEKEHSMKLSSKSDIWATGIIGYEMAFFGLNLGGNNGTKYDDEDDEDDEKDRQNFIILLSALYLQSNEDLSERMENKWDKYYPVFFTILCIRLQFPRLFHLITAILVYEPKQRPTAKGILDFLEGNCHFESMEGHSDAPMLFPWLSIAQLKDYLREKIVLFKEKVEESEGESEDEEEEEGAEEKAWSKRVEEADRLLWMASLKEWEPSERQGTRPCDTVTNKEEEEEQGEGDHPQEGQGKGKSDGITSNRRAPINTNNDNDLAAKFFSKWKATIFNKTLFKIMKTIGLSLSPSIQNESESVATKFEGTFENLQDSFYNHNPKLPFNMGDRIVCLLSTIGYEKLIELLGIVSKRYQKDAKMLNKMVRSVSELIDKEWAEIGQMVDKFEGDAALPERERKREWQWYAKCVDQIKAVYLYELNYKFLQQNLENSGIIGDHSLKRPSSLASFLLNWLRAILDNLKEHHAPKTNKILKSLERRKKQFEAKLSELEEEKKQIVQQKRAEFKDEVGAFGMTTAETEPEQHQQEMNNSTKPRSYGTRGNEKQHEDGKREKAKQQTQPGSGEGNNGGTYNTSRRRMGGTDAKNKENGTDNNSSANNSPPSNGHDSAMGNNPVKRREYLKTKFDAELLKISMEYEEKMSPVKEGLKLCQGIARQIEEFANII